MLFRPHLQEFLSTLSDYYEIVVFTAAYYDYADWVCDKIDPEGKYITTKLYRHHTTLKNNNYLKDISKLGRNLKKVIFIDNIFENFQLQKANGIYIKTWTGDENDICLLELMKILIEIVKDKVDDVRESLVKFRNEMIRSYLNGDPDPFKTLKKKLGVL